MWNLNHQRPDGYAKLTDDEAETALDDFVDYSIATGFRQQEVIDPQLLLPATSAPFRQDTTTMTPAHFANRPHVHQTQSANDHVQVKPPQQRLPDLNATQGAIQQPHQPTFTGIAGRPRSGLATDPSDWNATNFLSLTAPPARSQLQQPGHTRQIVVGGSFFPHMSPLHLAATLSSNQELDVDNSEDAFGKTPSSRPRKKRVTTGTKQNLLQAPDAPTPATQSKAKQASKTRGKKQDQLTVPPSSDDESEQEGPEDLEGLENRDPFAAAEAWISEHDEKLVPLPLKDDDVETMRQPKKVVEIAKRIFNSLLAPHKKITKPDWTEATLAHYEKKQQDATAKLQKSLSTAYDKKNTLAYCIRLVKHIIDIHANGMLQMHLPENTVGKPTHITEMNLKCSERCERVIDGVRDNKHVAVDIIKYETAKMVDLARAPVRYRRRKEQNSGSNLSRKDKKAEMQARLEAFEQGSDEEIPDHNSSSETPAATMSNPPTAPPGADRGSRGGKAVVAKSDTKQAQRTPKRTIAEAIADDEDIDEDAQGTNKRSKSSPPIATKARQGKKTSRSKRPALPPNFPEEPVDVPDLTGHTLDATSNRSPQTVEGASLDYFDYLMMDTQSGPFVQQQTQPRQPVVSSNLSVNFSSRTDTIASGHPGEARTVASQMPTAEAQRLAQEWEDLQLQLGREQASEPHGQHDWPGSNFE